MMYAPHFFHIKLRFGQKQILQISAGGPWWEWWPEDSGLEHLAARAGCGDGQFWTWGASGHGCW